MTQTGRRVRLTLYSDATYFGGAEGYLALLARHLDPAHFEISLVLPAGPGTAQLETAVRGCGGGIHHLPRPGFRWLPLLPEMIRVLRAADGEVLHINMPSSYDAGISSVAFAARQAGYGRVISTEHLPMVDRKYRKFPAKAFFTHWIDRVIVVAQATRRLLSQRHGVDLEKVCVIPNGVPEPPALSAEERAALRAQWGCAPGEVVLGITGQLTRRKGHHLLLEALARLAAAGPGPRANGNGAAGASDRLVVVGDGEEGEELRRQARELAAGRAHHLARPQGGRSAAWREPSISSCFPPRSRRCR